jgi:hypothetical protein
LAELALEKADVEWRKQPAVTADVFCATQDIADTEVRFWMREPAESSAWSLERNRRKAAT